ncbi:peptidase [Actinophytocola xinjiangensis]|uniref:Aminopeptidase N n=2 Tax=Actinophytocola xinjiangensis TaxID=485602 RepID=A0A7Z0WJX2_9PSEU|nr:peptidase [Actinophytocola xinjiangensis]
MYQVRAACLALATVGLAALTSCTGGSDNADPASPAPDRSAEQPRPEPTPGADGAGDPYYPQDGNGGYDVVGYHVSISYDPPSQRLDGDTVVTATATGQLTEFNLDLFGLEVSGVEVDGQPAEFARQGDHELVITPETPVTENARFETRVRYAGTPSIAGTGGLGENGWQIAASGGAFVAGEPHSATTWYPANDTPRDKATFRLDARVPDGWSVVSNGLEKPATQGTDGWTTYHWDEPNRIATYLTTVGIDKWTFERSTLPSGVPVVSAYAPGQEDKTQVEERLPEVIEFLTEKFGPYPQSAAGGIYINETIPFSLETQGRPVYADWAELDVVVHENAHQWYGNSVTVESWADICLNECFASYAQWLWEEAKDDADLDERYRTEVARATDRLWEDPLYDMGAGNEFGAVYRKGPLALHALRRTIGDDDFDRVLKEWPARHRDANASWPQFERFVEEVTGEDLTAFFDAWFRGTTQPGDDHLYPGTLRR